MNNQHYYDAINLKEGALDLLEFLKARSVSLAIITNGPADMQRAAIESVAIEHYFDFIFFSAELGVRKPDKAMFELACQKLDSDPEFTLMVGDNPTADIEGARSAGLQTIQIGTREPKAANTVLSLKELQLQLQNHS